MLPVVFGSRREEDQGHEPIEPGIDNRIGEDRQEFINGHEEHKGYQ